MDKRIAKSIQKIKDAYLELLFKVEPSKIYVKDICKLADINRSTFYDRYGFIESLEDEIIVEEVKRISLTTEDISNIPNNITKDLIREHINRFYDSKILTRLCSVQGRERYVDIIAHKQVDIEIQYLPNIDYYQAYFQCLGALSTLIEWMNNPKNSSLEDIIDIVYSHLKVVFDN